MCVCVLCASVRTRSPPKNQMKCILCSNSVFYGRMISRKSFCSPKMIVVHEMGSDIIRLKYFIRTFLPRTTLPVVRKKSRIFTAWNYPLATFGSIRFNTHSLSTDVYTLYRYSTSGLSIILTLFNALIFTRKMLMSFRMPDVPGFQPPQKLFFSLSSSISFFIFFSFH